MPRRSKKSKNWQISYTPMQGGKTVRASAKTTDFKEAQRLELEMRLKSAQQRYENALTIEDLFEKYFKELETTGRDLTCSKVMANHLIEFFKNQPLISLKGQSVRDYIFARHQTKYQGRNISLTTIRKELGVLSAAINYARREWDWELQNFVAGRTPKVDNKKDRWLTQEEAKILVENARQSKTKYLADFIVLVINTGMRKREALELEWSRIDFKRRLITLFADQTKSRKKRYVFLNSAAMESLRVLKSTSLNSNYVFHDVGQPIADIKKSFGTACAKSGFHDVTTHTLRHTCGTWLDLNGATESQIAAILGHSSSRSVTSRYIHSASAIEKMLEIAERISWRP